MFRLSYHKKVLYSFCVLSLVPLVLMAIFSALNLRTVEGVLRSSAIDALDQQAAEMLELRAVMVANEVRTFLRSAEDHLAAFAQLEPTSENYLHFSRTNRRQIWVRAGTNEESWEDRLVIPLYSELTFVGADGFERVRIQGDQVLNELRDVSNPANTTYLTETYFASARDLPPGRIYVSHVTGWHVNKMEQLQDAATPEEAVEGQNYKGVIRFARPVHAEDGHLKGVAVLSLDHRHLMEFTQHISPTEERFVVFPSYQSGNYAFMFDNEGWIITHPKLWDIRGLDRDGHLVPPFTEHSSPDAIARGIIPYNLGQAAFIHPNYPFAHQAVLGGRSGVVDVTNVGGSRKIMAYAPIFYDPGLYAESGVFGGVTIGAEVRQFHKTAEQASARINKLFAGFLGSAWILIGLTAVLVAFAAYKLSRSVTNPLSSLISTTREMARGNLETRVDIKSPAEVADLATAFNRMASQLRERQSRLLKTLSQLRNSRHEILRERNLTMTIVESVDTGILTLDIENRVTSFNSAAEHILGLREMPLKTALSDVLKDWPELKEVLENVPFQSKWGEYVSMERKGNALTFLLTLYPLTTGTDAGRILTVEDLTERVNLRQQMARFERLASLGRLSAGIAHEVRNPLTGISLLLDELHDRLLANPGDQLLIQKALQEIERLEGLVSELLHFSSLPVTRRSKGDIAKVLNDTLFLVKKQCERQNVELLIDLPEGLPHLSVDADQLKQAFLNLLTNALDAMPGGGRLSVSIRAGDENLCISFADTGEGIVAEKTALIFEPFYTTKGEGTGLGLSITHTIIANHGGHIEVKSRPGEGTTFEICLPFDGRKSPQM
jgi:PAS domain S-box-containing protein